MKGLLSVFEVNVQKIKDFKIKLMWVAGAAAVLYVAVGFFYYRSEYQLTEAVRLDNARFERERTDLLSKVTQLEQSVERMERFTSRVEAIEPANTRPLGKGVGPLLPSKATTPLSLLPGVDLKTGKPLALLDTETLSNALDGLQENASQIEGRLQAIYETRQSQKSFDVAIPSVWPVNGWLTSKFGHRHQPIAGGTTFHQGIDIAAPYGTPIQAPGDGVVTYAGYRSGYGNVLVIDHGYGIVTSYAHIALILAKEGERIRRGQVIAKVGNTGLSTGSHLHFEVVIDGIPVDPLAYLPKRDWLAKK